MIYIYICIWKVVRVQKTDTRNPWNHFFYFERTQTDFKPIQAEPEMKNHLSMDLSTGASGLAEASGMAAAATSEQN